LEFLSVTKLFTMAFRPDSITSGGTRS